MNYGDDLVSISIHWREQSTHPNQSRHPHTRLSKLLRRLLCFSLRRPRVPRLIRPPPPARCFRQLSGISFTIYVLYTNIERAK